MDYEKAYKEALDKIREGFQPLPDGAKISGVTRAFLEEVFPELKESWDDKIINAIKHGLKCLGWDHINGIRIVDMIAWLEKQGEQSTDKCEGCNNIKGCITCTDGDQWAHIKEQKPVDKVEPKFKIGDWIVHDMPDGNKVIRLIIGMTDKSYILNGEDSNAFYFNDLENDYHLWTIQDAKDGDVLVCENGWTCIFKTLVNDETFSSYCFMDATKWFCETGGECHTLKEEFVKAYNGKIYPATKGQRDLLFQKMKEAGYEWDAEIKELKKSEQKPAKQQ